MATSGSLATNTYSSTYLELSWSRTGYSSANCTTTIYWEIRAVRSKSGYVNARNISVTIDGRNEYTSGEVLLYNGTVIASGYRDVNMYNDGTGYVGIEISGAVYTYSTSVSASDSWTLDTIPRYPTGVGIYATSKTPTTVNINWYAGQNCSQIQYKIGSGNWIDVPGTGTSGSYTVTGLYPGNNYTIYGDFKRADSGLWAQSKPSININTTGVGKIISAPNFNDEENPTIQYTNESGDNVSSLQVCISLTRAEDDIPYRDVSKSGGSYTFELTEEERNTLREATTGNSRTVYFYIKSVYNGTTYYNSVARTLSIINANPVFNDFIFQDVNSTTVALTGDNQTIVNRYSNIQTIVSSANKAISQKLAGMISYKTIIGTKSDSVNYSDDEDVSMNIENVETGGEVNVYATDSRNNSTKVTKLANIINYTEPTIQSLSAKRENNVSKDVRLQFTVNYWNNSFGSVLNEMVCSYKYKNANSNQWITGTTTITFTVSGNTIIGDLLIAGDMFDGGFEIDNVYDIEFTASDKLASVTSTTSFQSGKPAIAIFKNCVAIGAPYDEILGGSLQLDGAKIIESGTSGNSHYIKFADGTAIYRNMVSISAAIQNVWGSMYESALVGFGYFPSGLFITKPYVYIQPADLACWVQSIKDTTKDYIGQAYLSRPVSTSSSTYSFYILAIGRWK